MDPAKLLIFLKAYGLRKAKSKRKPGKSQITQSNKTKSRT